MLGAIPTVLLITLVGSAWVASKAIAPVEEIRQAAKTITAQRLDQRLPVPPTNDEIAGLIEVLNATFERLQRSLPDATVTVGTHDHEWSPSWPFGCPQARNSPFGPPGQMW